MKAERSCGKCGISEKARETGQGSKRENTSEAPSGGILRQDTRTKRVKERNANWICIQRTLSRGIKNQGSSDAGLSLTRGSVLVSLDPFKAHSLRSDYTMHPKFDGIRINDCGSSGSTIN
ncbi:uncharacterized protein [Venturia canescens]|uniref:uncharacterized protein n=1 Tax=Venturia canescens TaxID=32260 RepID=UPI001C9D4CFD|nr:uncharacterized protein LOC122419330 [Venturia canescens]XP_043289710.1 uncharacterized protein LOC122419330 [Venturia canescens]XP_043289711.1 uncharacterized protein LOC122419330 [Venturia canescens]